MSVRQTRFQSPIVPTAVKGIPNVYLCPETKPYNNVLELSNMFLLPHGATKMHYFIVALPGASI